MRSAVAFVGVATAFTLAQPPSCEGGGDDAAPAPPAAPSPLWSALHAATLYSPLLYTPLWEFWAGGARSPSPPPPLSVVRSTAAAAAADLSWAPTPREPPLSPPPPPLSPHIAAHPAVGVASPVRQARVRAAFAHAWHGFRTFAWDHDELEPLTQTGVHSYGMGLTLVDSLDTMLLMGLETEAAEAIEWVEKHLTFGSQEEINLFEVTIRVLGGLLAAYEATDNEMLLAKAEELGKQLLFAFHTPHGLPYGTLGLKTKTRYNPKWSRGASTIAEVATLQLEFRALSRHTGDPSYEAVAQRAMDHLRTMPDAATVAGRGGKPPPATWPADLPRGLYPMFISVETGGFLSTEITLGARADSLYEYLLKQWLLSGKTDQRMRAMYEQSVFAIRNHLVRRGGEKRCGNCTYLAVWNHRTRSYREQMDHLACFVPGMLALGAHGPTASDDLELAAELMQTCVRMYTDSPSGLAAEIAEFNHASRVSAAPTAPHCLLRPETVESLFVMWRVTGEARYREWGWQIFEAIERHTRVATGGYAPVKDVTQKPLRLDGRMESFFTAETLKYLYLLFGDGSQYDLDLYTFNTEAHPLRILPEYAWGAPYGSMLDLSEIEQLERALQQQDRLNATRGPGSRNATEGDAASHATSHVEATWLESVASQRVLAEARAALLAGLPTMVGANS